jgi:hypothetical protein
MFGFVKWFRIEGDAEVLNDMTLKIDNTTGKEGVLDQLDHYVVRTPLCRSRHRYPLSQPQLVKDLSTPQVRSQTRDEALSGYSRHVESGSGMQTMKAS